MRAGYPSDYLDFATIRLAASMSLSLQAAGHYTLAGKAGIKPQC